MWKLYDALIEGIPNDLKVNRYMTGIHRTLVQAGNNIGLASTVKCDTRPKTFKETISRGSLKEVASLVKSWNLIEASIGLAAVNAYYNRYSELIFSPKVKPDVDAFKAYQNLVKGKKVALIGHFKSAVSLFSDLCRLSVIEKEPGPLDYPDQAAEFLLPNQDFVFITGMTFTNKTLPRLLQLAKNSRVILMGPSVPLSPLLFDFGIEMLCGFCVTEQDACIDAIQIGDARSFYSHGRKLSYSR
jgi:uncharacterized protein (DUF4213/DUF364 family)